MTTPEIEELKLLIEEKYGKQLLTTTDYEEFSGFIERVLGRTVSSSTLKRLWGYVNDNHKPREVTLDVLASYLGHKSFGDFCRWLKTSSRYNSSFFHAGQLVSADIEKGATVSIGWPPNRLIELSYLGESTYEVKHASNSKMQRGDRFVTGCLIKGQPLYLPYLERDGERTPPFVAGRNGGLTVVELKN